MTNTSPGVAEPRRLRRRWWIAGSVALLVTIGGYGGYWYATTPVPPQIELGGADPEVAQAIGEAEAAVRRSPRSAGAWGKLGMVLSANGFPYQADACFAQAEELDRGSPSWPYLHANHLLDVDRAAGMVCLRRALARVEPTDPRAPTMHLVLAEVLIETGGLDEAASLCRGVLERDSGDLRAQFDLGLIALVQDDPQRSAELLTRALASPHVARRARLHLATAARRMGDTENAAAYFRRAQELPEDPDWPDPETDKVKAYQAGLARRMGDLRELANRGDIGGLLGPMRELADASGDGVAQARLGTFLVAGGDFAAAEPVLRDALKKMPDLGVARLNLGIALLNLGEQAAKPGQSTAAQARFREAADLLRAEIAQRPGHGQAHLHLGRCLQHLGQPNEALTAFRSAVQVQPELAEAHFALGEALARAGEQKQALYHLKHAQSLAPADARIRAAVERWSATSEKPLHERPK
jgi:tetratricopeptide (TPR) repeat protein